MSAAGAREDVPIRSFIRSIRCRASQLKRFEMAEIAGLIGAAMADRRMAKAHVKQNMG